LDGGVVGGPEGWGTRIWCSEGIYVAVDIAVEIEENCQFGIICVTRSTIR
jgi:hypothetical protein